jgi:CRP/FNR family transcriptional regulator, cyclic AMP receptor protein
MSLPRETHTASRDVDKLALLRGNALFAELPPAAIERLASYMTRRSVRRGTTIFVKGDPGTGLMGVLSGTVKITVLAPDGREAVLNIIGEGEVFGEIALLDGHPRTADAIAMTDCELVVIDRRDFVPFLRSHPDIALKFIEIICARLRRTSEQVEDVMLLDMPSRLAKTLLQLTRPAGAPERARVKITQREISQIIGKSRESTNKQLRAWAKRGWIRLERGGVSVLAPDKLVAVAAEGSELDPS